jgi:hypothetical protein
MGDKFSEEGRKNIAFFGPAFLQRRALKTFFKPESVIVSLQGFCRGKICATCNGYQVLPEVAIPGNCFPIIDFKANLQKLFTAGPLTMVKKGLRF